MKCIVFDLDGTLAESKQSIDSHMAELIIQLLKRYKVAIISGAKFEQFVSQVISQLKLSDEDTKSLFLLPTNATNFYVHTDGEWQSIYNDALTDVEMNRIISSFQIAFKKSNFKQPKELYGEQFEKRGSQVTFSALGQLAPIHKKAYWDVGLLKRTAVCRALEKVLPEYSIKVGGMTSIDVTKKGHDKASGIEKIKRHLNVTSENIVFVGDSLLPGGNDYSVRSTGVSTVHVTSVEATKFFVKGLILA